MTALGRSMSFGGVAVTIFPVGNKELLIVSTSVHRLLTCVLALGLLSSPVASAWTQAAEAKGIRPVMVVSIANSDKILGDIGFLTETAGAGDIGRLVALMAAPYTAGLDKTKPAGAYLPAEGLERMDVIGFVGVRDLDLLLSILQDQFGQPRDAGDGVKELGTDQGQSVFLKEVEGWAFFAPRKALLSDLPRNPARLLGDMPENYTLAVRLNVNNIPAEMRQMAVQQLRVGFEEGLRGQPLDEQQAQLARDMGESWMESIVSLVDDSQHVTIGWQVDAQEKSTHLDISVTAQPKTQLAQDMGQVRESSSAFSGVLHPGAAAGMLVASPYTESDIKQTLALIELARAEAMKGLDADQGLTSPEEREVAKKIVGDLLDLAKETIEAGKMDLGGCLVLMPEALTAVLGGFVSDGNKLAATVQELHAFAKTKDARTPNVNFNAATHRGVTFHTASIPLPSDADAIARKVLGNPMEVVIGTGETSVYLALGKDAQRMLVEIIDTSAEQADTLVPPSQLWIALTPILEFVASVDDNPVIRSLLMTLKATEGKDRIAMTVLPIPRGMTVRISLDAGVITMVGEGVRELAPLLQNLSF
ncbi:MAG: hypothetical protein EA424_26600 [Planctomycetaceae bacterium]|nr:MAG: hypothetical protein EA424_26600 [Planctomycetaceae bacterium]